MIITKAGKFKMIRFLCVFCAILFGFLTLVGTSEDDADDIVDIDFDTDADLELDSITVNESVNTLSSILAAGDANCGTTTINDALEAANIDDLDEVDIDSVTLNGASGTYTANWTPGTVTTFSCSATVSGSQADITVDETAINGSEGTIVVSTDNLSALEYYLNNRDETFTYCVTCTDTELDTFSVTYDITLDVNIEGTI
ncbi:MAG: hypothetical protein KJO26_15450 [Deltaproteobacteria bacterium]|nr:hypothetical protein [Deltaproteobacteria bacterium]